MMTTRNDFDRADTEKLGAMMYALIQNWLRQNDLEIDVLFFICLKCIEIYLQILSWQVNFHFGVEGGTMKILFSI